MGRGRSPGRTWIARALAAVLGTAAAAAATELVFRLHPPRLVRMAGEERAYTENLTEGEGRRVLTTDERLGYRPVAGGAEYGPHGARWNDYALEKPAGTQRVLFLGDSVTYRGKLVDALREVWGEGVEYWNAGVEGYSTSQEVLYFEEHLAALEADHVVLTFHLNDFETTPMTFRDESGRVRVFFSRRPLGELSPWLLRHSHLYRFLVGFTIDNVAPHGFEDEVALEVRDSLAHLARLCAERGARLSVLVLPWLAPPERWPPQIALRRRRALELLEGLGIDHHDLTAPLEDALGQGLDVQEEPGDHDHPSAAFARVAARALAAGGLEP